MLEGGAGECCAGSIDYGRLHRISSRVALDGAEDPALIDVDNLLQRGFQFLVSLPRNGYLLPLFFCEFFQFLYASFEGDDCLRICQFRAARDQAEAMAFAADNQIFALYRADFADLPRQGSGTCGLDA